MNRFRTSRVLLFTTTVALVLTFGFSHPCLYYDDGFTDVRCVDLSFNFTKIPQDFNTEIEVLKIRYQNIENLIENSFVNYPQLQDISIEFSHLKVIDTNAFATLSKLKLLNLELNELKYVPHNIFAIPSLRTLQLYGNELTDDGLNSILVPSAIEELDLSYNNLTKIPDLKFFYKLRILDVYKNNISDFEIERFAPLCSLHEFITDFKNLKYEKKNCKCRSKQRWIEKRNIMISDWTINCLEPNSSCQSNNQFSSWILESRTNCLRKNVFSEKHVEFDTAVFLSVLKKYQNIKVEVYYDVNKF